MIALHMELFSLHVVQHLEQWGPDPGQDLWELLLSQK